MNLNKRTGGRVALAIAAVASAGALAGVTGGPSAHADPAWGPASHPLVAVGSNTIEDLFDAFSGTVPTPGDAPSTQQYHTFVPLADPKTGEQVYSWDAINQASGSTPGDCISAKPGFAPIARPNGSGDGKIAISDAVSNVAWSKATSSGACAAQSPQGQIDIGRSSSAPAGGTCSSGTGACLAWVDIAHDAVSYGYYIQTGSGDSTSQADHLTNAQLTSLYSSSTGTYTDPATNVTYAACLPQLGSGTEKFFIGTLNGGAGVNQTTAENAAKAANCVNFEENGANTFQTFSNSALSSDSSDSPPPTVAITPFSVGSWISQENGYAFDRSTTGVANGVHLGYTDASGSGQLPYTGSPGSEAPNPSFYTGAYGRDLYVEMSNTALNGRTSQQNGPMKDIFGNFCTSSTGCTPPTSPVSNSTTGSGVICGSYVQSTELPDFGFTAPAAACGTETITAVTTGAGA